jgi:hypothetical protein
MHLIETYAASSGLQIDRPQIYEKFFPIPFEKYIVLHSGGGMPSKQYEFYSDVVSMLRPILQKHKIEIVQVGAKSDPYVHQTVDLRGATSIHQTAYVIKHSQLLVGNDSCNLHIASGSDVPIVGLYGSTTPYNHGPYFSSEGKTILLVGDLKGNKPSYSEQESDKVINTIKPEEVVRAILKLLKIRNKVKRESVFFGKQYQNYSLDLVPNCLLSAEVFHEITPTIRMDLEFSENYLAANLRTRPYNILTKKNINIDLLKFMKKHVRTLVYQLDDDYDPEFVENIRRAGINYALYTFMEGAELAKAKLDLFDFGIISEGQRKGKEVLEQYPNITKESKYKTNKYFLSKDKIYLNRYRYEKDESVSDFTQNTDTITLDPEFFDYSEHFYVFNE